MKNTAVSIAVLVLISVVFSAWSKESAPTALTQNDAAPERYLAFQMFSNASHKAPGAMDESLAMLRSGEEVGAFFKDLDGKVNHRGMPGRRLAVFAGPLSFDHSDAEVVQHIKDCFVMASKYKIAIGFHIDESKFWAHYRPFQGKPEILEWIDWEGTPSTGQYLNWGQEFRLQPQLCLNHPLVKAETGRRARDVFARPVARELEILKQSNEEHLFAGMIIGWETALAVDWETRKRTGYHALSNVGLSRVSSQQEIDAALKQLIEDTIGIWASEFRKIGIPKSKLYTHIAFEAEITADNFQQKKNVTDQSYAFYYGGAIPEYAFSQWGQPGFSTYPHRDRFRQIYTWLEQKEQTTWASAEGANVFPRMGGAEKPQDSMESYLAYMFNHGATLVTIFGWNVGAADNPFRLSAEHPDAVTAYRKFLSGEALTEGDLDQAYQHPAERLRQKIPLMQESIRAYAQRGEDIRVVQEKVQQIEPLLKQGRVNEALKLVDEVLEITQ